MDNGIAICECLESGDRLELEINHLPENAKEGDVIRREGDGYVVDQALTKQRKDELTDRMNRLFKKHSS